MQIEIGFPGNRKISAKVRDFEIMTDQPVTAGGDNTAPTPFELFLASIGTCAGIFIKGFCLQRNISTDSMKIIQEVERGSEPGILGKVKLTIKVPADFPEKYYDALINTASLCSVKKSMQNPPVFEVLVEAAG